MCCAHYGLDVFKFLSFCMRRDLNFFDAKIHSTFIIFVGLFQNVFIIL